MNAGPIMSVEWKYHSAVGSRAHGGNRRGLHGDDTCADMERQFPFVNVLLMLPLYAPPISNGMLRSKDTAAEDDATSSPGAGASWVCTGTSALHR